MIKGIPHVHSKPSDVLYSPNQFLGWDLNQDMLLDILIGERSLMTSLIRVGRGVQDSPKKGRYRVGQGR